MSVTGDLLDGLAAYLAGEGVGTTGSPTVPFAVSDTAIVRSIMPEEPDRAVVLTAYRLGGDDPTHPATAYSLQIRTRGVPNDPGDCDSLDDQVTDLIEGMTDRWFGSCHVTDAALKSSLPMGRDSNNRSQRSANFTLNTDTPATAYRTY